MKKNNFIYNNLNEYQSSSGLSSIKSKFKAFSATNCNQCGANNAPSLNAKTFWNAIFITSPTHLNLSNAYKTIRRAKS